MNELLFGLQVAVIGMVTVFVGLVVLIVVFMAQGKLLWRPASKRAPEAGPQAAPQAAAAVPAPQRAVQPAGQNEIVAVITAAIMAAQGENVQITSIRKLPSRRQGGTSAWAQAGRQEQIYSRYQ